MAKRTALLVVLAAAACSRTPSPDRLYRTSESLLREGKLEQARETAEQGYRAQPGWRFRLLSIEAQLQIDPKKALQEIANAGDADSPEDRARLERDRGWASYLSADYAAAETALSRAAALAAPLHQPLLEAQIEIDRATVLAQKGISAEAEEEFRDALRRVAQSGDSSLQVRAYGSLGWFLLFTHRPDEAIYWLEKQRDEAERTGWTRSAANALGNLGSAYYRLGDFDAALPLLHKAEARFAQLGDRRQQQIWLGNIGNVLLDQEHYEQAVPIYTQAAAIARQLGDAYWDASWEDNLAIAYRHLGDYDRAEVHNQEALRLKQSVGSAVLLPLVNEAGIAAGRGDFSAAEKLYRSILASPSDDPVPLLQAQSGLAKVLAETGQSARADVQFRAGIEQVERRRAGLARDEFKLSYFSSLIDFYQRYVDFLVGLGQADRAAEVADSSRARLLDDRLSESRSAPPPSVAAFRQLARSSHAIVLSYWLAPDRSFLWIITPDRVALQILPSEKQIEPLVESYRSFIENLRDPLAAEFPDGRRLSEILLGPVRPLLHDGARLVIVPDRALHSLNFETLPDPDGTPRYLIDRATVIVAPSLAVLTAPRPPANASRRILLMGDPDPAVEEFPRLPYASQEMDRIGQSFGSANCTRLSGARAFPAAYRQADPAQFSWIHFAAHASANRENPLDSALILSRHDGVYALPAREVMEIPLHADLVTLSACRGAGAKTYSGEGLVGLAWAFLRAGARNVVAGLWDVTDLSTASLMADFYQQMEQNMAPADALRAAKLKLVHSIGAYRKPFYWGPFQLYAGIGP